MSTPRALVVTDSVPFPPRNGRELTTAGVIEALAGHCRVDLAVLTQGGDARGRARARAADVDLNDIFFLESVSRSPTMQVAEELLLKRATFSVSQIRSVDLEPLRSRAPYDVAWISPIGCAAVLDAFPGPDPLARRTGLGLNDVKTTLYFDSVRELLHVRSAWQLKRFVRAARIPWVWIHERRILRRFHVVQVQTSQEARRAEAVLGRVKDRPSIVVAPNGRKRALEAVDAAPEGPDILFMAHLAGGRAYESRWFLDRVWPRILEENPRAVLHLVGTPPAESSPPSWASGDAVRIHGFVDDLAEFYRSMAVAVVPTFHGTGLINRVLDALTAGVPVVATSRALGTIDGLVPGRHALQADTPGAFAGAVCDLLADQDLWKSVAREGRALAMGHPTWSESLERVTRALGLDQGQG